MNSTTIKKNIQTGFNIQKATKDNIEKVVEMCREVSFNMMNNHIGEWEMVFPDREIIQKDIAKENLYVALAEDGITVMACAVLDDSQNPEFDKIGWKYGKDKYFVLRRLMVSNHYEGMGIGNTMLKYLEDVAKQLSCVSLRIELFSQNQTAIDFYNKRGYKIAGTILLKKGKFYGCEKKL
jgi:GNAT superfamily N-acetyltransferase